MKLARPGMGVAEPPQLAVDEHRESRPVDGGLHLCEPTAGDRGLLERIGIAAVPDGPASI